MALYETYGTANVVEEAPIFPGVNGKLLTAVKLNFKG
jgi:hypothetical protein